MLDHAKKYIDYPIEPIFIKIDMLGIYRRLTSLVSPLPGWRTLNEGYPPQRGRGAGFFYKYLPTYLQCVRCKQTFLYSELLEVRKWDQSYSCRCPICRAPDCCSFIIEEPDKDEFELILKMQGK